LDEKASHSEDNNKADNKERGLRADIEDLSNNLDQTRAEKASLENKSARQSDKISSLEANLTSEMTSHNNDKNKAEDRERELQNDLTNKSSQLDQTKATLRGREDTINSLQRAKSGAETSTEEKLRQIAELQGERSELQHGLRTAEDTITTMKKEKAEVDDKLEKKSNAYDEMLKNTDQERIELKDEVHPNPNPNPNPNWRRELKDEVHHLETTKIELEEHLKNAKENITQLKADQADTDGKLGRKMKDYDALVQSSDLERTQLNDNIRHLEADLESSKEHCETLKAENASLKASLDETETKKRESNEMSLALSSALKDEKAKHTHDNTEHEAKINSLKMTLIDRDAELAREHGEGVDLSKRIRIMEKAAAEADSRFHAEEEQARRKQQELQAEIVSLQAAVENRNTKVDFESTERVKIAHELEAADEIKRHALLKADAADRESKATREEMEAKLAMVEGEISAHNQELKETRTERRGIEQSLRKQTAENMVLHNTLEGRERKVKSLQKEVRLMTKELQEINARTDTHDKQSELNTALLGDMKCKEELLKIADMNEKQADKTISALKEELIDTRVAREKLRECEAELSKASKQIISLMMARKAMDERQKALSDEVDQLKKESNRDLYDTLIKKDKEIEHLTQDKQEAAIDFEIVNNHVIKLAAKLDKEQDGKRGLYGTIAKLSTKLGQAIDLPDIGPGILKISLGRVNGLQSLAEHELEISSKSQNGGGADLNDPYVQFKVKDHKVESSYKTGAGSRAVWDHETLTLECPGHDCLMSCKVIDWERFGTHRDLGSGWIDLTTLASGKKQTMEVELQPQGKLNFEVEFSPVL